MASKLEDEDLHHGRADQNDNPTSHVTSTNPLSNPKTNSRKTFKHASLSRLETCLYFGFTIATMIYGQYRMSVISGDYIGRLRKSYFDENTWFPFNHGYRDNSDYEWRFWKSHTLTLRTLYSALMYIVLGRLVDWFIPELRKVSLLSFGLIFVGVTMPVRIVIFFAGHTAVAYIGSLTRSKWVIWSVALLQTASIFANTSFYQWQKSHLPGLEEFRSPFGFSILRFVSFALECCRNDEKSKDYGLMDLLLYTYYFPLFTGGPVLTFNQFHEQVNKSATPLTVTEWWNIIRNILRFVFWYFYTDIFLHFSYLNALDKHAGLLSSLPARDYPILAGWHLLFFQMKYIIFYGFPVTLAMFDRIAAPQPPACVVSLYTFRNMWRYFDRGIHAIIMRYIYFPLGGSKHGLFWNSAGALIAFSFIGMWHGSSYKMYAWALLNWLGIQLEIVVVWLSWTPRALDMQRRLSGQTLRRVCALCAAFNHMFLSFSNGIFLVGFHNVWIYTYGIYLQGFPWVVLMLCLLFYCNSQIIMEVQRRYSMDFVYNKKYI